MKRIETLHDHARKMKALTDGTKQKMRTRPGGVRSRMPRRTASPRRGRSEVACQRITRRPTPARSSSAMTPTGDRVYASRRSEKDTHWTGRKTAVMSMETASAMWSVQPVYFSGRRAE